jgi:hypothetical protein
MGNSTWSSNTYSAGVAYRSATKTPTFGYSSSGARVVHQTLDPAQLGALGVRESRDSTEHPNSLAVMVWIDVTGSMMKVPVTLQSLLPELYDTIIDRQYAPDPHILFGAIGDATAGDPAPLQVSQFEAGNEADQHLRNILLVGGGGGGRQESYELAMYFAARKTAIDCLEKREKKGYMFIIGDEMAYPYIRAAQVRSLIGDDLKDDIPLEVILTQLKEMYHVYYIMPVGASHKGDMQILNYWKDLLGQNVLELNDLNKVAETIAIAIGLQEGTAKPDDVEQLSSSASSAVSQLVP